MAPADGPTRIFTALVAVKVVTPTLRFRLKHKVTKKHGKNL